MTLKTVAGRLETAAETDPGLVIALRAAYRGRHDVQDALWWRAHPLSRTPGGRPDPLVGLGEEQAAVCSRSRIDGPRSEVADPDTGEPVSATLGEHRLRELTRLLAQDAAALDLVLVSFRGWPDFGPEDDDPEPGATPASLGDARPDRRPARGILLVTAGGAAGLLIGVAVTLALRAP
ncbi:hypothetical protein RCH16_002124 [Cryobacterium sp. MP_M5]|uniref:hypothetical protein n=1 Tax=unclassified Cryobacterium TaxID=2649013 RepID=UPI0018CAB3DC|nr:MULTISPECIES: hypothetical protein [unclassified Cryobacterium]MBG6058877.1 hypothetical protein [Cryobacterium sp. MP_M3]MEC5177114.1 hypothetical protein [Cryobacterium sp. MP_M5]